MPSNTGLYATVKAYNKNNESASSSSRRFYVDLSPPELSIKPAFLTNYLSVDNNKNQWEKSILRLAWQFYDSESSIIRHIVTLSTHHEGHTPIENIELGHENNLTVHLDGKNWLQNGDRYKATVTACNAAGLCSTAQTEDLLIDSTPPHLGGFKPPLTWQNIFDINMEVKCIVNLTWYGFHDQESGIKTFYIGVGRTFTENELSAGLVKFDTETLEGGLNISITLNEPLASNDKIVLSIVAENMVGLRSSIGRVTVLALASSVSHSHDKSGGILELEKHSCDVHFCNKDCTCSVIGKVCTETSTTLSCKPTKSTLSTTSDVYVSVYGGLPSSPQTITASSSCISTHWLVEKGISKIKRFEWTAGIKNGKPGEGIVDLLSERPWIDVGKEQLKIQCLPLNRTLEHGTEYIAYVKVWVEMDTFLTFKSQPIMVDHTPPGVTRGKFVIDSDMACLSDYDFIDKTDHITACWEGVFNEYQGRIVYYTVGLGTTPKGKSTKDL